jgi:hypothetical protein
MIITDSLLLNLAKAFEINRGVAQGAEPKTDRINFLIEHLVFAGLASIIFFNE